MNFVVGASEATEGSQVKVIVIFKDRMELSILDGIDSKESMGEKGVITWQYGRRGEPHLLLVGLGDEAKLTTEIIRAAAGSAGRAVEQQKLESAEVVLEILKYGEALSEATALTAWVEGWLLGTYAFDKYKTKKAPRHVQTVHLQSAEGVDVDKAVRLGEIRAEGTILARDLGNEPPNQLRPDTLVQRAVEHFAKENKNVKVQVYQGEQLAEKQMNGIIAVGKGSVHPPALLELSYCSDPSKPLIALVGKGITFDTGGISLKSGRDLSDMRIDMGGAAAVLGALHIIVASGIAVNVVAIVATAENMPDGASMLPGEVIQYANQITVQVKNTDAEGRLVLADALIHAANLGAARIVDIATLTGACAVSLGERMAGVWGDDSMTAKLQSIGRSNGDKAWPMPLEDEYEDMLESHYADLSNISMGPYGGAITAALFLRRFVDSSIPWAHVDMAGPMEADATKGYIAAGATGYGARLLADFTAEYSG
ncbi:leucyl aminopeptidase [Paenibacillus eucommiae]|uniref:Probable cytosol aminopeptidase n=1 Tax=Paenibacillus eucommiae TaxID=1355755 RepID=A0ABS4ILT4_9BACL|nr:leucyl aminopeptidase [Paenibacillus eucommiae]MBP1988468.1 leucyl aminopeptidase [Paenibacillus eucommiae]